MGRQVRRVDLANPPPMGQTWSGYINPFVRDGLKNCPHCEGSGLNPATKALSNDWYDLDHYDHPERPSREWSHAITQDEVDALVAAERLYDFTHRWSRETGWTPLDPPPTVTAEAVNRWSRSGFGHDSINQGICVETRAKRLGVWGLCAACAGSGESWLTPEHKANSEAWTATDPPTGEGWQLWETTSEGSPISPAFAAPEELARWLANTGASSCGSLTEAYETWLAFIRGRGWAPSGVSGEHGFRSGVAAFAEPTT